MHLAQLRAQDARDADRANELSAILQMVDQATSQRVLGTVMGGYFPKS